MGNDELFFAISGLIISLLSLCVAWITYRNTEKIKVTVSNTVKNTMFNVKREQLLKELSKCRKALKTSQTENTRPSKNDELIQCLEYIFACLRRFLPNDSDDFNQLKTWIEMHDSQKSDIPSPDLNDSITIIREMNTYSCIFGKLQDLIENGGYFDESKSL